MKHVAVFFLLLLSVAAQDQFAVAQTSASYRLEEFIFNAGGHPKQGVVLTSAQLQLTLVSVGQSVAEAALAGKSFSADTGFIITFPPATEVGLMRFTTTDTLSWDAVPSMDIYNVYQGTLTSPFDPGYGSCLSAGLRSPSTLVGQSPPIGGTFFYVATALNRLGEEGIKGQASSGGVRANLTPCAVAGGTP